MPRNISKLFIVIFSVFILSVSSVNYSYADNHLSKKEIVKELKKEINNLGGTPVKRKHLLSSLTKWIDELKLQLEKLKKVDALKAELNKELEDLGEKIETKENQEIEADEQIIALRKQIEEVKAKKKAAEEKKKREAKIAVAI